ncbi:sporulation inhibitor of replication protein SirA [Heyndrickxia oleronia]|uniref:sporulation inhibitor of replication protein SirA n=1 Tax=Heyndrickxia oleronia TaxID=38875 RepID=UPI00203E359D|nr:sporulation inhibitor of replication protein SirA [Heyndrickxia oleronia]MCM3237590.1 sporulation inhibitor of replication protein SirA [Heyndrickxia oleronia]
MRAYQIYLIEDEVAEYYYGRERMFYDLFIEYFHVSGRLKQIIRRQIEYITKPIPVLHIQYLVGQAFAKKKELIVEDHVYKFRDSDRTNGVELMIGENSLRLQAWGKFDSESAFLEILRKYDGRLLAIDFENERYGWIKPIKERKYV